MSRRVKTNSPIMLKIIEAVRDTKQITKAGIARKAGVNDKTISSGGYLAALCRDGIIHVAKLKRNVRGTPLRVYSIGPAPEGLTLTAPIKLTMRDRAQRWKRKVGYNEARKHARAITRQAIGEAKVMRKAGIKPLVARRDPLLAALMGA